ncbi:MAG: segregation/condensation protein A [Clostridia bacterium]|nr:segregation/condensation protein A [Clostridia bacterium]
MEKINYKIEVFEGPLDLLLHLISKHKIDINDIPILELVEQYTDYVKMMQEENMDVASEFLEMAARLVYIKSVSLLPVQEEEAQQLKMELTGELLEYQQCKAIAEELSTHTDGFDFFSRQPQTFDPDKTYRRSHEPFEILRAYLSAIGKGKRKLPPPVEAFSGIVARKIVSVSSRINKIVTDLLKSKKKRITDFFSSAESRSELVATFLALLELAKSKKVYISGECDEAQVELLNEGENL